MATPIRGRIFQRGGRIFQRGSFSVLREYFRWSGEKRPPKAGEFFLSGAIPEVYQTKHDLDAPYHIMVRTELAPGEKLIDGVIYVPKAGQCV